jgi:WD40 repeat protein
MGDGETVLYGKYNTYGQPPLDWSTPGDIAYTDPTMIYDPTTCARASSQPAILAAMNSNTISDLGGQVVFSPDGKRVLVFGGTEGYVLNAATGDILAVLQMSAHAAFFEGYGQAVWAADGTEIVAVTHNGMSTNLQAYKVQEWNSRTGHLIRTALNFNPAPNAWLSPDASYAAVQLTNNSLQFWDVATSQLVSTTAHTATGPGGTVAWSPDGAYFALGINSARTSITTGHVQIWSSTAGQLVTTLTDTYTFKGIIDGLAWSPNGKYLAESSGQINIWDATTWQRIAAFGTVRTSARLGNSDVTSYSQIETMAWSPDSTLLASVTHSYDASPVNPQIGIPTITNDYNRLAVWSITSPRVEPTTPAITPTSTLPGPTPTPLPGVTPTLSSGSTPTPTPAGSTMTERPTNSA